MADALAHRGPDDSGTWSAGFLDRAANWDVALGHRRLSILDLSAHGHQPMVSDDGQAVIAYNGEIYNHAAIRAELEGLGFRFHSTCDTEVALNAYCAWGIDAFSRFNGMFGIAIWDGREQRLVLARDRIGIKPLYYRFAKGILTFGSELSALRRHPAFRPELNAEAVATYVRFGWLTGERAIYEDTYRLLPGHVLVWRRGEIHTDSFWRMSDYAPKEGVHDFASAVDELDTLLGDAVEARMISDVPLGAFLSGGVDSSTIVALMQERSQRPVKTFAIGFDEKELNEAPFALDVAKHIGTEHTELYVSQKEAREVLHELPTLYDEPYSDPSCIPTVLLSRLTREHVTVALSGDGGDELFGGYTRYRKIAQLLPLLRLPHSLRKLLHTVSPILGKPSLRNGLARLVLSRDAAELAQTFHGDLDTAMQETVRREGSTRSSSHFLDAFSEAPVDDVPRRMMYAEAQTYMNDDILVKVDRATMAVGLEARVPILDHRVVQFAFGLPMSILTHEGATKAPLRGVLYRRVPKALIERPKHGFGFPLRSLLGPELDAWKKKYLSRERLEEEGIFDPIGIARVLRAEGKSQGQADDELWRLLCFQRWYAANHRGES